MRYNQCAIIVVVANSAINLIRYNNHSSMSQLLDIYHNHPHTHDDTTTIEFITQLQELITVLKQEIIRLQNQLHLRNISEQQLKEQLLKANQTISILNQKIANISENNESLIQTVQVFQREFIRREGGPLAKISFENNSASGPFHLEIVRNLKSKFSNTHIQPSNKATQKSIFAEYYGFFLQDDSVEQSQVTLFNEIVQNKKPVRASKIRSKGRKNYFHQNFRHIFWYSCMDNHQKINEKLYSILLDQLQNSLQNTLPKTTIIDLDLRRMDLRLDQEKTRSIAAEIKKLLQLFQIYRPEIKYVQGMSYLAWIFIIRMNPYQAFVCFCNLILSDNFVYSLYNFNQHNIKRIVSFFEECINDKKPKLYKHMKELVVDNELFLIEWAYTMYSRAFSLRIISKIWDLWFSEGYNAFFKVAMTVFQLLQSELLTKNENDKFVDTIRNGCFKIEQTEFLKLLSKQKLFQELKLQ